MHYIDGSGCKVMSPLQVLLEHFQTTKYSYSGFVQSQLWKDRHQHHDNLCHLIPTVYSCSLNRQILYTAHI